MSNEYSFLGEKIREIRRQKKFSLKDLAEQVEVTSSFLSQVELSKVMPSLITTMKIAEVLQVPINQLVENTTNNIQVVRSEKRMKLGIPGSNILRESLIEGFDHSLQIFSVELRPGQFSSESLLSHASEEVMLILEGSLYVKIGDFETILNEGDSILYDGIFPHMNGCHGETKVVYIVINVPPII